MPTTAELLVASKAAWDAYMTALHDIQEYGWTTTTDQAAKYAALDVLWEAYKTARAALNGAY